MRLLQGVSDMNDSTPTSLKAQKAPQVYPLLPDTTFDIQTFWDSPSTGACPVETTLANAYSSRCAEYSPLATIDIFEASYGEQNLPSKYGINNFLSMEPGLELEAHVKPKRDDWRCFEHGCGGKAFSCSENLRRHCREKCKSKAVICKFCKTSIHKEK
jgi:hypothetical protein